MAEIYAMELDPTPFTAGEALSLLLHRIKAVEADGGHSQVGTAFAFRLEGNRLVCSTDTAVAATSSRLSVGDFAVCGPWPEETQGEGE